MSIDHVEIKTPETELNHLPVWKVAVIGFSFMSVALTIGLSPAYAVQTAGQGATYAQLLGLVGMLLIAVAVSAFAKRHVVSGSLMSYVYFAFGDWGKSLVAGFQLCGYLAMAASITAATQIFMIGAMNDAGFDINSSLLLKSASVLLIVFGSCFFTCKGIEASVRIAIGLAILSIPPIACIIAMAAVKNSPDFALQFDVKGMTLDGVVQGAVATLAFLIAFEGLSTLAAETDNPKRNIPRLLYILLIVVGGAGVIATFLEAPLLLQSQAALAQGASPVALLADLAGVPWMKLPADILLVLTGFSATIAVKTFASRIYSTAGKEGILPRWLGTTHGPSRTPRRAAIAVSVGVSLALVLPMIATKVSPVDLGAIYGSAVVTFWLVPYAMICLAAIQQELKNSIEPDTSVMICSALGFLVMIFMLVNTFSASADGSAVAWVPWGVFGIAIPSTIWLLRKIQYQNIQDF